MTHHACPPPARTEGLPSSAHWEGEDTRPAASAGPHKVQSSACLSLAQASPQGFSSDEETEAQSGEVSPARPSPQQAAGGEDHPVPAARSITPSRPCLCRTLLHRGQPQSPMSLPHGAPFLTTEVPHTRAKLGHGLWTADSKGSCGGGAGLRGAARLILSEIPPPHPELQGLEEEPWTGWALEHPETWGG